MSRQIEPWTNRRERLMPVAGRPAMFGCACLIASILIAPSPSHGQHDVPAKAGDEADTLSGIDAEYQKQRARIDRERIERLARLAATQKGGEAEVTYLELFRFAVASDRYVDAEPAAERVIRSGSMGQEVAFLAQLVNIIAEAERGDYDGSLRDLKAYVAARAPGAAPAAQIPTRTLLTIGEAYFRRLVRGGRFDLAREVCDIVTERTENPAVREHFAGYRRRLALVGRPAPALRGPDVDGVEVNLGNLKGKVVLVVFWATWCNPCVERIPLMNRTLELHERDGFTILGVNLDSGPDRAELVRRYVVDFGIPWPNALSGEGEHDIARAYAVSEIPANVLIDRDGTVVTFDVGTADLVRVVAQAVGQSKATRRNPGR